MAELSSKGAAYIFGYATVTGWTQRAYLKASVSTFGARFGSAIAMSDNGLVLAVASDNERSSARGVNGDDTDTMAPNSGAVFVFTCGDGATWVQHSYLKASNTTADDRFGISLAMSADGNTIAVGATFEDSNADTINGEQEDESSSASGAAYVFKRSADAWLQSAYFKAFNSDQGDQFGSSLSLSGDGNVLAVGAAQEDSAARVVNGDASSDSADNAGAAYVFSKNAEVWESNSYVKATNTDANDLFGYALALSADGLKLAISASQEASTAAGIDGDQSNNSAQGAGAAYFFDF